MNNLTQKIRETQNKPLDIWFFLVFLLFFSSNIRKVAFYFPIQRTFNEYTGIYVYISDIFILLAILAWFLSTLYNNSKILSMFKLWISRLIHSLYLPLPFLLVVFAFLSLFWAQNKSLALFRSLKLFEYYMLYLYVIFRIIPYWLPELKNQCSTWNIGKQSPSQRVKEASDDKNIYAKFSNVPRGTLENKNKGQKDNLDFELQKKAFEVKTFFLIIIWIGFIQALVGIFQFLLQHSLGLFWLKESLISPEIPGVAKIILSGHKYIRAYGLFPHPNILGGFLMFSIILTILYIQMFHVEHFAQTIRQTKEKPSKISPIQTRKCSTWNIFNREKSSQILSEIWSFGKNSFIKAILVIEFLALLFSFSKSALLGLIIALVYIQYKDQKCSTWNIRNDYYAETKEKKFFNQAKNIWNVPRGTLGKAMLEKNQSEIKTSNPDVPRGTLGNKISSLGTFFRKSKFTETYSMFHVEHQKPWKAKKTYETNPWRKIFLLILIFATMLIITKPDWSSILFQPLKERIFYLNVSRGTILANPLFGIGMGQFVLEIAKFSSIKPLFWQFQPVHNIFLLIWSELGLIGLALFITWMWKMFHVEHFQKFHLWQDYKKDPGDNYPKNSLKQNISSSAKYLSETKVASLSDIENTPSNVPRGTLENSSPKNLNKCFSILSNNRYILSIESIQLYFEGILVGLLFIGLFDHYLWDIQAGSFLLWITTGIIAGTKIQILKISKADISKSL